MDREKVISVFSTQGGARQKSEVGVGRTGSNGKQYVVVDFFLALLRDRLYSENS